MGLHLVTGYAGSAHITSADTGAFNASVYGAGEYVLESGKGFSASVISNNQIRILDGDILMQGRHINLKANTYADIEIANGLQGMNRNDLIVVRYTKDATTGIESTDFVVIQGVSTDGTATDPEYTTGDILSGDCLLNDMPLYRVVLSGLNVSEVVPLFKTVTTVEILKNASDAIEALLGDTDISAIGDGTVTGILGDMHTQRFNLTSTSKDNYYKPWLEIQAHFSEMPVGMYLYGTISAGYTYFYEGHILNDKFASFVIHSYYTKYDYHVFLNNGTWSYEQRATQADIDAFNGYFTDYQLATKTFNGANGDTVDDVTEYLDSGCLPTTKYTHYIRSIQIASINYPAFNNSGGMFYIEGFMSGNLSYGWQIARCYGNSTTSINQWTRSLLNGTWTDWTDRFNNYLPFTGGTMTGNVITQSLGPQSDCVSILGSNNSAYLSAFAQRYYIRNGGINYGSVEVVPETTEGAGGYSRLQLGNNKAVGTAGSAQGYIVLFGYDTGYTAVRCSNNGSDNVEVKLPNASGTLMLKDKIYIDDEGYLVIDLD